jgi:hypothetical protein
VRSPIKRKLTDTKARAAFPPPPVAASGLLVPITSWPELVREAAITGVKFDLFWYDRVEEEVAYFFSWLGEPRCTVLVVWNDEWPAHIEGRKANDLLATPTEHLPIIAEVTQMFRGAGFWREKATH